MWDGLSGTWSWPTAIFTAFVLPVLVVLAAAVRKALVQWSRYALDGLLYIIGKYVTQRLAAVFSLRRFARLQLANNKTRILLVPAREDVSLETDAAFVPLTLEGPLRDERYDHASVINCGPRIRVIGEPGSGKTTILKRILRDECQKCLKRDRLAKLPILYELKRLRPPADLSKVELSEWFLGELRADLLRSDVYKMGECFDSFLSNYGILLLLDGADEISSSIYETAQTAILAVSERLSQFSEKNVIIITMRNQFYQQTRHALSNEYPLVLEAKPFSLTDIYRFLTVWPFEKDAQEHATRIYGDLLDRPTLRDMCANPLVLSMYVAEDQLTGHPLVPESRTEFYTRITDELLVRRRAAQTGRPASISKLREERERFLGRLAFEHLLDETQSPNLVQWNDAVRIYRDLFQCNDEDAKERVLDIAINTGLISEERAAETLRFVHLTFCEFLAALHAVRARRDGWRHLLQVSRQFTQSASETTFSRLDQVLPFAAGLMPSYHAKEDALSEITTLENSRIIGLTFLETKQYDNEIWVHFCRERFSYFITSLEKITHSPSWLQELHLFAVVVKDYMATLSVSDIRESQALFMSELEGFFQKLDNDGDEVLTQIISAYASRDSVTAFRIATLCKFDILSRMPDVVADNCDNPAIVALVMDEVAYSSGERSENWARVMATAVLRSEAAAQALYTTPSPAAWSEAYARVNLTKRWDLIFDQRNAMTDALSISHGDAAKRSVLPEIDLLHSMPSPSLLRVQQKVKFLFGFLVLGAFPAMVFCLPYIVDRESVRLFVNDPLYFLQSGSLYDLVIIILLGIVAYFPFIFSLYFFAQARKLRQFSAQLKGVELTLFYGVSFVDFLKSGLGAFILFERARIPRTPPIRDIARLKARIKERGPRDIWIAPIILWICRRGKASTFSRPTCVDNSTDFSETH